MTLLGRKQNTCNEFLQYLVVSTLLETDQNSSIIIFRYQSKNVIAIQ